MPRLTAKIRNTKYRLYRVYEDSYDIQQYINGTWNTIDSFGKCYNGIRPWGYLGYSFSSPGQAFNHFVKLQTTTGK